MRWRNSAIALLVAAGTAAVAQQAPPLPEGVQASGPAGTSGATKSYDEVGYAGVGAGPAISATSATLPAGAYAEVTALDTGKTILLRISGAGTADGLTTLSPAAAQLLGVSGARVPVRVREVDPPDVDAVALREGHPASARMDAPPVLLTGLRTLLKQKDVPAPAPTPAPKKAVAEKPAPAPAPTPKPPAATPTVKGRYQVQVATFSTRDRAARVARAMDGHVQPAGRYFRVRLGPFQARADANRARDAAAKRGYADARVLTDD